jgi:hypothetical protein
MTSGQGAGQPPVPSGPQLGGLFAGGMPKLRSTGSRLLPGILIYLYSQFGLQMIRQPKMYRHYQIGRYRNTNQLAK